MGPEKRNGTLFKYYVQVHRIRIEFPFLDSSALGWAIYIQLRRDAPHVAQHEEEEEKPPRRQPHSIMGTGPLQCSDAVEWECSFHCVNREEQEQKASPAETVEEGNEKPYLARSISVTESHHCRWDSHQISAIISIVVTSIEEPSQLNEDKVLLMDLVTIRWIQVLVQHLRIKLRKGVIGHERGRQEQRHSLPRYIKAW